MQNHDRFRSSTDRRASFYTGTAGKEFSAKGVNIAEVTLHVGLGTFRPVKVDDDYAASYAFGVLTMVDEEAAAESHQS